MHLLSELSLKPFLHFLNFYTHRQTHIQASNTYILTAGIFNSCQSHGNLSDSVTNLLIAPWDVH